MDRAEQIINYLIETYDPNAIIMYGSFADGSAGKNSDFDAIVITDHVKKHDASVIGETVLDVFLYPLETFRSDYDPMDFIQVFDGKIILDKSGMAKELKQKVLDYIDRTPAKSAEEIQQEIDWCEKMLSRTIRGDAEGFYRWHWLLCDSLEIYSDINRLFYHGPKKALRQMEASNQEAFALYTQALKELNHDHLAAWINYLKSISGWTVGGFRRRRPNPFREGEFQKSEFLIPGN